MAVRLLQGFSHLLLLCFFEVRDYLLPLMPLAALENSIVPEGVRYGFVNAFTAIGDHQQSPADQSTEHLFDAAAVLGAALDYSQGLFDAFHGNAQGDDHLLACQVRAINEQGYIRLFFQGSAGKFFYCFTTLFNEVPADTGSTQSKAVQQLAGYLAVIAGAQSFEHAHHHLFLLLRQLFEVIIEWDVIDCTRGLVYNPGHGY